MRMVIVLAVWTAAGVLVCGQVAPVGEVVSQSDPRLVGRFLSSAGTSLTSYRAVRHLEASARGGRMRATLSALTSFNLEDGFHYEVLAEEGSGAIRSKVLRAALAAEQKATLRGEAGKASLTETNYEFTAEGVAEDGLMRVGLRPRREDALLITGSVMLDPESADLVRVEGTLIKRPSFWTRRVHVTRSYSRLLGVRVPISMASQADVLIVGASSFSMTYDYSSINDMPVDAAAK